jgi:RNA polymerase sigma-B factor
MDAAASVTDADRTSMSKAERRRRTRELYEAYAATGERRYRNDLIELHLDLADFFARRYRRQGASFEDLRQLALLAMVRCVDRFDPDQQVEFSTFASRTIEGELKRYFRDRTWAVRPPRGAQELHLRARAGEDELTQLLGRTPTVHELAKHLDESVDDVLTALEVSHSRYAASLDSPATSHDDQSDSTLGDVALAWFDESFQQVDASDAITRVVAGLDERDRMIVHLRFFENLSQQEVASAVGVSQSYLSRVLRRILDDLRDQLEGDAATYDVAEAVPA